MNLNSTHVYLETERLLLRNFCMADLESLVDYRRHPDCARYQRGQFTDRENLSSLIERSKTDDPFSEGEILVYGKQFIYESVMICNGNYVLE